MNPKKFLENHIRGWLPKKPALPSHQRIQRARNVGTEQGMEMRRRLEENWRSNVMAGVIAIGCGLLLISLKSAWFIAGLSSFISYGIAYYSLSKLSERIKGNQRKWRHS